MKKEELVEKIKEKRKKMNLSIEEVVEKTKLHPLVIKSIEEGKWDEINPTYLKGFLKIYCSFLGIEFDESLISSNKEVEIVREKKTPTFAQKKKGEASERLFFLKKMGFFFLLRYKLILILFLIIGVLFFLAKIKIFFPKPKKKAFSSITSPQEKVEVTLTAKRDCFIKVKEEGKFVFEGLLKKGMRETWQAKELEFWISDGSAVILEVNGEVQPPLTKLPKPIKSLKIKSGSITVIK